MSDAPRTPPGAGLARSSLPPIERMIGYASLGRRFESVYAFISRIMVANQLNQAEANATIPEELAHAALRADYHFLPDAVAWLVARGVDPEAAACRVDPREWEPLPGFNSVPPERLRICTKCLELQFHTWAWSSDTVAHCALHDVPLTDQCPKCSVNLLPKGQTLRKSAFHCPRGCTLSAAPFGGLGGAASEPGAKLLEDQLTWVRTVRATVAVRAGPAHTAYPPYLTIANLRSPPLPSAGLTNAVLAAMEAAGAGLPERLGWHTPDPGVWRVEVVPWQLAITEIPAERLEHARRSIRRTSYVTHLPILDLAVFRDWFDRTPGVHPWIDLEKLVMVSGDVVSIPVPSHVLIGNELHALRQLLARQAPPDMAASIYQEVLFDILVGAVDRTLQLDRRRPTGEALWTAERLDAVLEAKGKLWRLTAKSFGAPESSGAWVDYQEPAELGMGYIYIANRRQRL